MNSSDLPDPENQSSPVEPTVSSSTGGDNKKTRLSGLFANTTLLLTGKGAQEGYLAALDQAVISLSNFVATIIIARSVPPSELGVYGVGFTILRLVRAVQEGLTIQPLNAFGAALDQTKFKRLATSTSLIQILLAVSSALVFWTSGWIATRMGNDVAGPTLASLWFPVLTWQTQEYLRRMLYARGKISNAVANSILANIPRLVLLVWWANNNVLTGIRGLEAIGWGALLALIQGVWATRQYWTRKFDNLRLVWKRNWDFGRWISGGNIANWVSVEFYPILTAGMISFAAAGAYRALQNLVAPIQLLLRAIDTFLLPRAARIYQKSGWADLLRTLRLIYVMAGIPILGALIFIVIFRYQILEILYGSTYLEYSNGIILFAIFYTLWFAYTPLQTVLEAIKVSRPIFIANFFAILAMFTVGLWLINEWGVYGTIAGQILNSLIVLAILGAAWRVLRRNA